jgi:hypothetical protein
MHFFKEIFQTKKSTLQPKFFCVSVAWFAMANTVQAQSDLILKCGQQYDRDHGITISMQPTQNKFWKIRSVKRGGGSLAKH